MQAARLSPDDPLVHNERGVLVFAAAPDPFLSSIAPARWRFNELAACVQAFRARDFAAAEAHLTAALKLAPQALSPRPRADLSGWLP